MVPIETVFIGLCLLFAIIGALRGWAKELLVTFSVILARFVEYVCITYVPVLNTALQTIRDTDPKIWFYVRVGIFVVLVSFGYATTVLSAKLGARARKEKLQDTMLGAFLGAINGYFAVGTFWGFLSEINYAIWDIQPELSEAAIGIMKYLPLVWLDGPAVLLVAVAVSLLSY